MKVKLIDNDMKRESVYPQSESVTFSLTLLRFIFSFTAAPLGLEFRITGITASHLKKIVSF